LKDKQGESTSHPPNVIPVVSTAVLSTLRIAPTPSVPVVTAETITGTTTGGIAQVWVSGLSLEELIKSMEELKLQVSELQKVQEQFVTL